MFLPPFAELSISLYACITLIPVEGKVKFFGSSTDANNEKQHILLLRRRVSYPRQVAPGRVSLQGVKSAIYPSRFPGPQPRRHEHKTHPAGFALDTHHLLNDLQVLIARREFCYHTKYKMITSARIQNRYFGGLIMAIS